MCVEYARTRDPELRTQILNDHRWLAEVCAGQMRRRGEQFEDLVQVANIGLIQALERFDPSFGVTFRTYASASILGVLRRHYRSIWRVHVPRRMQELNLAVGRVVNTLTSELHRSPTTDEIAEHLGVSADDVRQAMLAGHSYWPGQSLPDDDPTSTCVPPASTDDIELADIRGEVRSLLASLPARSQTILYLRFFEELTQSEIAERLGIGQVHVSRLIRRALAQLRAQASTERGRRFADDDDQAIHAQAS